MNATIKQAMQQQGYPILETYRINKATLETRWRDMRRALMEGDASLPFQRAGELAAAMCYALVTEEYQRLTRYVLAIETNVARLKPHNVLHVSEQEKCDLYDWVQADASNFREHLQMLSQTCTLSQDALMYKERVLQGQWYL